MRHKMSKKAIENPMAKRHISKFGLLLSLLLAMLFANVQAAHAVKIFAIRSNNLISFDNAMPGTIATTVSISGFAPAVGSAGTAIVIRGTNFGNASQVLVGGVAAPVCA